MPKALQNSLPLRQLRIDANLSLDAAATAISAELGRPISIPYLRDVLERRGTTMYEYIRAIARAYGLSMDEVWRAARNDE